MAAGGAAGRTTTAAAEEDYTSYPEAKSEEPTHLVPELVALRKLFSFGHIYTQIPSECYPSKHVQEAEAEANPYHPIPSLESSFSIKSSHCSL